MKVLAIEPHGDDGCCSFTSVLRGDFDIDLLTFAVRPSDGLDSIYPNIKSLQYFNHDDLNFYLRPKVTTHEIHKLYVEDTTNVRDYYIEKVKEVYPEYSDAVSKVSSVLRSILSENSYDIVLYPVGLNHPYHIVVHEGVEGIKESYDSLFVAYADKPYLANRYVMEMYNHYKKYKGNLLEIESPKVDKESEIRKVLKEVYPTEQNMLRFSSEILLEGTDLYTLPNDSPEQLRLKFINKLK